MAEKGWICLEMAVNVWEITENGWKLLEMAEHGWKRTKVAGLEEEEEKAMTALLPAGS